MVSKGAGLLEYTQTGQRHRSRFAGFRDLDIASSPPVKRQRNLYGKDRHRSQSGSVWQLGPLALIW